MLSVTEGREFYRKGKKGGSALVCARGFRPTAADEGSFLLEDYVRGGGRSYFCVYHTTGSNFACAIDCSSASATCSRSINTITHRPTCGRAFRLMRFEAPQPTSW